MQFLQTSGLHQMASARFLQSVRGATSRFVTFRARTSLPRNTLHVRYMSGPHEQEHWKVEGKSAEEKVRAWQNMYGMQSSGLPDWIEHWSRKAFYKVGVGLLVGSAAIVYVDLGGIAPWVACGVTAFYWTVGLRDISQHRHPFPSNALPLSSFDLFSPVCL
jgi:hypothetical protein